MIQCVLGISTHKWLGMPAYEWLLIFQGLIIVGGSIGILLAWCRLRLADQNRRQEQFRIGAELLDYKQHGFTARVAAAALLSKLVHDQPKDYHQLVMKTFEASICWPPQFKSDVGGHRRGEVDYASPDTVQIVKAINARNQKLKNEYKINLPDWAPFETDDYGNVRARRAHKDFVAWLEAEGDAPRFDDD